MPGQTANLGACAANEFCSIHDILRQTTVFRVPSTSKTSQHLALKKTPGTGAGYWNHVIFQTRMGIPGFPHGLSDPDPQKNIRGSCLAGTQPQMWHSWCTPNRHGSMVATKPTKKMPGMCPKSMIFTAIYGYSRTGKRIFQSCLGLWYLLMFFPKNRQSHSWGDHAWFPCLGPADFVATRLLYIANQNGGHFGPTRPVSLGTKQFILGDKTLSHIIFFCLQNHKWLLPLPDNLEPNNRLWLKLRWRRQWRPRPERPPPPPPPPPTSSSSLSLA